MVLYLVMAKEKTFHERKKERKEYLEKNVWGWKERPCVACNGTGHYDAEGAPYCAACDGSGKEKYNPVENN